MAGRLSGFVGREEFGRFRGKKRTQCIDLTIEFTVEDGLKSPASVTIS